MLFETEEIKDIFENIFEQNEEPAITEQIVFIPKQHNDKHAAAKRYAIVEELLVDWYRQVNATNTRSIPVDLAVLYNVACKILLDIKNREREIILEGRE